MASLNWTTEAEQWLLDIFRYIAEDDPLAARKVVQGIYDRARILKDFPHIGYRYEETGEGEIRVLLYGHFRIAYRVKSDDQLDVLGVFHGAMELDCYLPQKRDK